RPSKRGSSRCSTEAKNESASACRIVASSRTNVCSHRDAPAGNSPVRESPAMDVQVHLTAFMGVAALLIVTPGPDTALVTKNALLYGRRPAIGTSFGVTTGLLIWTVASALGVAAIVHASEALFTAM